VTVGSNLNYRFSRLLHGNFDIKYRNRRSTLADADFDELAVFVSLTYGFGGVNRPTQVGGF